MKILFRMKEFLKVSASGESLNQLTQPSQTCFFKSTKILHAATARKHRRGIGIYRKKETMAAIPPHWT